MKINLRNGKVSFFKCYVLFYFLRALSYISLILQLGDLQKYKAHAAIVGAKLSIQN